METVAVINYNNTSDEEARAATDRLIPKINKLNQWLNNSHWKIDDAVSVLVTCLVGLYQSNLKFMTPQEKRTTARMFHDLASLFE